MAGSGKDLEVEDFWELAQKICTSFELPQRMSELHQVENYYLTSQVLKCLCQIDFLPLPDPKFPLQDIQVGQLEKTIAHVQVLQYWVEKSNPPTPGQPGLLVGSILELREVIEPYISFPDDTILGGVAPPEGFLEDQPETTMSGSVQPASAKPPVEGAAAEEATPIWRPLEEPSTSETLSEEQTRGVMFPTQFPGWREVLHPSSLVTAAGQTPPIPHESRQMPCSWSSGERKAQHQRAEEHQQIEQTEQESLSPTGPLEMVQEVAPPLGVQKVMACL